MFFYFLQRIKIVHTTRKKSQHNWDEILSDFEKLMLIKCLCEEKLVFMITEFVKRNLGQTFVESPQINLHLLYDYSIK